MSVEFYRAPPGKFDSRTLSREILSRWTVRKQDAARMKMLRSFKSPPGWKHTHYVLQINGVNTNGAAAKVMNFDRLGEKVRPGTSGKIKAGQRECPKGPSVKEHEIRSDPISADPICPFPN